MSIIALPAFNDNYIWLIINENQHTFACVDPGDAAPVLTYSKKNGLILTTILLTHHHHDHAGGVAELLQTFPTASVVGPADKRIPHVTTYVRDEDIVHIDTLDFRVLHTPGHTSSHVCYQEPTKGWLFCGDTLFSVGCGKVFDGTMEMLHRSITLLKNLPKDTKVFCGHEYTQRNAQFALTVEPENATLLTYYNHLKENPHQCSLPSTIGFERKINPFMRTHTLSIQKFAAQNGVVSTNSFDVFNLLRMKKDSYI